MKPLSTASLTLLVTTLATSSVTSTDASVYGRSLLAPRRYQYSRRPHHRDATTAFDLVSDMLSMPVYMNNLMRQHQHDVGHHRLMEESASLAPPYLVTEDPETGIVELSIELPGVHANDLSVTLEDDRLLRIRGSRKHRNYESEFDQSFQLTDGLDPDQLHVTLSAGILRVQARKKEKLIKQIPVLTAGGAEEEVLLTSVRDGAKTEEKPVIDVESEEVAVEVDGLTIKEEEV